ncbi:NADPH2:quinone reductase [Exophiala aquamarina CBS 119918]|uniref:NADPH2:quinone reductase n=1 Tax=Exophiala aquamarina CBS 119918 TaxID=1182545 RepID=A0A072PEV9_9EURO|nr:NADPH2:quinone reductase [Exophiala aquamarina CBS 119918]KEF58411.1 NADPH2:quinone reductase [Exophiala aquamarina CBS 119918]
MQAVDIKGGKGPISALFFTNIPRPIPGVGEALVKIKAFGLNRMDLVQREGRYPMPPQAGPILGVEFSGTIESFGDESAESEFEIGDKVFGLAYSGAYAEYVAVSIRMLIRKPDELSWEEAAGIPETWLTAIKALFVVGGYRTGQSVLWHAGASSVSLAGIQLAMAAGAREVYVTTSTQEKIDFCKSIGATEGFNYKLGRWADSVLAYTQGQGVDIILDFVGAAHFNQNIDAVAVDGCVISLGTMGGGVVQEPVDLGRILKKRVRYEGTTLRARNEDYQGKLRDRLVAMAMPRFIDGSFKVIVEKIFHWEDVQKAQELLASNTTKGKIICTIS